MENAASAAPHVPEVTALAVPEVLVTAVQLERRPCENSQGCHSTAMVASVLSEHPWLPAVSNAKKKNPLQNVLEEKFFECPAANWLWINPVTFSARTRGKLFDFRSEEHN